jgi:hypothetical protein
MTRQPRPLRRLPSRISEAIEAVLDHFWQDEARDYVASERASQRNHIFNEMLTVRQWLANDGKMCIRRVDDEE